MVRLEELEAAQLSPPRKPPFIPSSSSTPADDAVSSLVTTNVSRDPGDTRRHNAAVPVTGHVPPGPAPALPAGAQVQTLEEIEAGLRSMDVSSSSPVTVGGGASVSGGGDLSAFNKLLHLVNKSAPVSAEVSSP